MKTSTTKTRYIHLVLAAVMSVFLILGSSCTPDQTRPEDKPQARIDDWNTQTDVSAATPRGRGVAATPSAPVPAPTPTPATVPAQSPSGGNIGLAAGGAKDINNFRENIKQGYLPLPTDVTYEGLFYDYYFETGQTEATDKLFSPSYSYAVTADPFSGETDYYLSVGLNSGMKESDFQRKKLNLVIVLDISGSMSSPFNQYYYDQFGKQVGLPREDSGKSKIRIATEAVTALLDHLNDDDYLGMVLFNDTAYLAKPLNRVGKTDMEAIKDHILEISATGGTNLDAGMQMATGLYNELTDVDQSQYEKRIIFLTDAMPNLGNTSERGLLGMTKKNAGNHVYTTFIGIGVDFNTELIEYITKMRGANYYSVHSAKQFRERMDGEFDYMVTPLVFNLHLTLETKGWEIEKVYGSPEANEATGELMKVNTLFPSKREGGETRGGLILLKLRRTGAGNNLLLKVTYEDRSGRADSSETLVRLDKGAPEYFDNNGIRKGVLLSHYADLLKNWMIDERDHVRVSTEWEPRVNDRKGIVVPPEFMLGRWERQSLSLAVSEPYRELFAEFLNYFKQEMRTLNDETMGRELEILNKLSRK